MEKLTKQEIEILLEPAFDRIEYLNSGATDWENDFPADVVRERKHEVLELERITDKFLKLNSSCDLSKRSTK